MTSVWRVYFKVFVKSGKELISAGKGTSLKGANENNMNVGSFNTYHLIGQALYCTYKVTLRRVRATIVVVEKQ